MTREEIKKAMRDTKKEVVIKNLHELLSLVEDYPEYEDCISYAIEKLEQQPSEDCVSRQNVINYIRTLSCDLSYWSVTDEVVKDIEKLPPVTPTQGWIPVTEDAPPIGTICLWCNKQGSVFVSEITYRSEKFSYVGQHGYFCNGLKNHGNIVAWQPLPKPYKAEMESEE